MRLSYSAAAAAMAMLLAACVATGQTPAPSGTPSLLVQGGDDAAEPVTDSTEFRSESAGTTDGAISIVRNASGASASTGGTTGGPVHVSVTVSRLGVRAKPKVADEFPSTAAEQPAQAVGALMRDDVSEGGPPPSPPPSDTSPGVNPMCPLLCGSNSRCVFQSLLLSDGLCTCRHLLPIAVVQRACV